MFDCRLVDLCLGRGLCCCCFTSMVMSGRSVNLPTFFLGRLCVHTFARD